MECVEACVPGYCYEIGLTGGSCVRCDDDPEDNPPPDDEPPEDEPPPDDEPPEDEPPPDDDPPEPPDPGDLATNAQVDKTGDQITNQVWKMGNSVNVQIDKTGDFIVSAMDAFSDQIVRQIDKSADRIVDAAEGNTTDVLNQLEEIEDAIADGNQRLADAIAAGDEAQAEALQNLLDGLAEELEEALGAEPGEVSAIAQSETELPAPADFNVDWDALGRPEIPSDQIKTWGEIAGVISSGFATSPLGEAINGLSFSIPESGGCTPWTKDVPFFGRTLSLSVDGHCTIWPDLAPIISAISVMAYSFVALRAFIR
jgi:hypothetical protein